MGEASAGARRGYGNAIARSAAGWLYLAAAPTFAIMALLTGVLGGPADALCSSAGASPIAGMTPMYSLMSAFHLAPWLRLVANRRSGAGASELKWHPAYLDISSRGKHEQRPFRRMRLRSDPP